MTDTGNDNKLPYTVGYKKPPAKTQFKKGHSGNERGKVAGRKNLKTEIMEELSIRIIVTENGKQFKLRVSGLVSDRWSRRASFHWTSQAKEAVWDLYASFVRSPECRSKPKLLVN